MKTIHDYIKEYGKYTFLEKEFNEVDNVILSLLSYVDFNKIVPGIGDGKITLEEASRMFYMMNTKKEIDYNITSVRNASHLLGELAESIRFKDLLLYNYEYKVTFDMQFGALCIKLPDKSVYISFEGTDGYVSGWKEDFMFTYQFPTSAQIYARDYLNMVVGFFSPKVYVGGHSKGGNLAIVSSMYCKKRVYHKIKKIYNNDGPGLRKEEFSSKQYNKIREKLHTLVPRESFIGMLLHNHDDYFVVDSKNKKFLQHDALSWIVEGDHFKKTELSSFSKKMKEGILKWLDNHDDKQKEKFTNALFSILAKAEIHDLSEIKKAKLNSIIKIIKETKNLDKKTRDMLHKGFKDLIEELK